MHLDLMLTFVAKIHKSTLTFEAKIQKSFLT